jgi:hypothetical protein
MRKGFLCSLLVYLGYTTALCAQAFQNLDFEDATLSPVPAGQYGGLVPVTDAFPHWTGYLGANQVTQVLQNNSTLGDASIDIFGPDWPYGGIIQGQYTALLQCGGNPFTHDSSDLLDASLAQVGLVPVGAKSIQLEVSPWLGASFAVSFDGQALSLSPVGSGPTYTLYGGDISAFAGQVGELRLTTLSTATAPYSGVYFDAITFSPDAIPEPSCLSLVLVGVACLAFWHRAGRRAA